MRERHIVAMSGGGGFDRHIDDFVLRLARRKRPKVCFVGTASGDSDSYIAAFHAAFPPSRAQASHLRFFDRFPSDLRALVTTQDVIYVGGGSTANLLAVWRIHGFDEALRAAWQAGVVLCGVSAGAICWFKAGITQSHSYEDLSVPEFERLTNGLAFLPGSFCPHYNREAARRPAYRYALSKGFPAGYAADDGVALHFVGDRLKEAVASRREAFAYRLGMSRGKLFERRLRTRYIGERRAK